MSRMCEVASALILAGLALTSGGGIVGAARAAAQTSPAAHVEVAQLKPLRVTGPQPDSSAAALALTRFEVVQLKTLKVAAAQLVATAPQPSGPAEPIVTDGLPVAA